MKLIKNIINNMKIRTKLIISYLSIVIVTVLIVGVYLISRMNNIVVENAIKEGRYNNNSVKSRMEEVLKLAINTSDMIYQDDNLHSMLKREYDNYGQVVSAYNEYTILRDYLKYYNEFNGVEMYVDNDTLLSATGIFKVTDEIRESSWYKKAIEDKGIITWLYKKDETTGNYSLSLVRAINSTSRGHIGVLVISINPNYLANIVNDERYKTSILVDGRVIYSNDLKVGEIADLGRSEAEASYYYEINEEFNENGDHLILNTFKLDKSFNNTFQVLVNVPVDIITMESSTVINKGILIIGVAIMSSLIVILYFSKNFSDRINILRSEMHKVVKGNFNIKKSMDGNDEISEVYDDLYIMMESINKLIDEVYIRKIQQEKLMVKQKEAEFKMLASQINPHFLYNTLETIRMRAFCSGDRELASIVKKLGKIMRRNLEVSNQNVSFESELELVKNYLEIQELRFKGKVEHEFNIEVNAKKYNILPLLLQPIVENAFVHGLEGTKEKGKIIVSAFEDFGYLLVEISDNGCGMSRERLEFINDNLGKTNKKENGHQSIGMGNINERIKIFYGDKYGIHVFSELNVGTKIVLVLPAIEGDEDLC
ncbi:cache domain-containing sensor histidine kinase [Paraclostridium bifermentans]|uniref:cache domain-containing sensor histidine kinase n=1 Tax=Paraclostridium bifermentans TaxID=1490 RepID=UPI00189FC27C|nr:sensor histidine kinase [Paraclostridium bifermentans]